MAKRCQRKISLDTQMIMEEKTRNCVRCDEKFYLIPHGRTQYCSDECYTQQALANNKNPVGHMSGTVGVPERGGCCYDEIHIPEEVMFILQCQDDYLRITEDPYYILKCLEDLPVARYSDGRSLTSTRAYRRRIANRIEVGYNNYKPPILGSKRAERKVVEIKHYATTEDKITKLEREQQNYTVWEEDDD